MEGFLEGQIRHGSTTAMHAVRAAIMRACPPLLRGLARMIASFARATEPGAGHPTDLEDAMSRTPSVDARDRAAKALAYCHEGGANLPELWADGRRVLGVTLQPPQTWGRRSETTEAPPGAGFFIAPGCGLDFWRGETPAAEREACSNWSF